MNDLFIKERTSLLPKFIGNWDKLGFVVGPAGFEPATN
tara:strand:- start:7 stop:120 length:114 start_codon:yes stop_codon:yes gene_type:complete